MLELDTVRLASEDGIATLVLERPEAANTISYELMADMNSALDHVETDDSIRVLLVTGAGDRHFCGGADLRSILKPPPEELADRIRPSFIDRFEQLPQPVIAVINGAAMGGGCEIALACDFRLMSETAKIGVPEIRFGALPSGGGTQRLPRIVGLAKAKEMVLTGRHLSAEEALSIGLVTEIAPHDELMERARTLAAELSERAAYALAAGKQLLHAALDTPLADGVELERRLTREMGTPEERQAARESAAKRSPTYGKIFGER